MSKLQDLVDAAMTAQAKLLERPPSATKEDLEDYRSKTFAIAFHLKLAMRMYGYPDIIVLGDSCYHMYHDVIASGERAWYIRKIKFHTA